MELKIILMETFHILDQLIKKLTNIKTVAANEVENVDQFNRILSSFKCLIVVTK